MNYTLHLCRFIPNHTDYTLPYLHPRLKQLFEEETIKDIEASHTYLKTVRGQPETEGCLQYMLCKLYMEKK